MTILTILTILIGGSVEEKIFGSRVERPFVFSGQSDKDIALAKTDPHYKQIASLPKYSSLDLPDNVAWVFPKKLVHMSGS